MAKRKVNKSEKIREAMKANPKAGPTEIVKLLAAEKPAVKVTPAMVSNVKAALTGDKKPAGRRGRPAGSKNKAKPVASGNLAAVAEFIKSQGGLDAAKAALDEVSSLAGLL